MKHAVDWTSAARDETRSAVSHENPEIYDDFSDRCPAVAEALGQLATAIEKVSPFNARETRLIKIALALGSKNEVAVQNLIVKGLAKELTEEEVRGLMMLAITTCGFPTALTGWRTTDAVVAGTAMRVH
jgi:4-carboxymuconolactone decarboxylase